MRKTLYLLISTLLTLTACGGSGDSAPPVEDECSLAAQKQFVLDAMRDVYFWHESLPASVDLNAFAGPEELLAHLISFQPLDSFSFINSAEADAEFFGEGKFEGFGFSSRFVTDDEWRFVRVFSGSPAEQAGFVRGQRILELDGRTIAEIQANEGVNEVLLQATVEFRIQNADLTEFVATVTEDIVTIDPLPQWRVIDTATGSVGYMEMAQFISTADARFEEIFAAFRQASVTDLIIDLRYNGGGLVTTAELLGDFLGGAIANNLVFSKTVYNENNMDANRTEFFQGLTNSMSLSRLIVIGTNGTASASELVINSMEPYAEVAIVGANTFGKPVGQVGLQFCEKILRPTAFETVNALDEGQYFGGLPVDCPAADDLSVPVGDDTDPNMQAAMAYLATGACPPVSSQQKFAPPFESRPRKPRRGPPSREFADAY